MYHARSTAIKYMLLYDLASVSHSFPHAQSATDQSLRKDQVQLNIAFLTNIRRNKHNIKMISFRTFIAIFVLFCSVIHSAMAYTVYYGSWYLYVWIPLLIIAIIRCCCYLNRKNEPEQRVVYVEGSPPTQAQTNTTISTSQMTTGVGVVVPPQFQPAPPYNGLAQGDAVFNSVYTPDSTTAYPPKATETAYPPTAQSAAYPPPPAYNEAVKLPVTDAAAAPPAQ